MNKYLYFSIVLIGAFLLIKNSSTFVKDVVVDHEVESIKTDIDKIEKTDNIDDLVENLESFNEEAFREFEEMKARAKSPATIQFVEMTKKQNDLAARGQAMTREMQPLINNLNQEASDDPEKMKTLLTPLCSRFKEYIPLFSDMVNTVWLKSSLLDKNPVISNELFAGEHEKMKSLIKHLLDSQTRTLEQEKQSYILLHCDEILAQSGEVFL